MNHVGLVQAYLARTGAEVTRGLQQYSPDNRGREYSGEAAGGGAGEQQVPAVLAHGRDALVAGDAAHGQGKVGAIDGQEVALAPPGDQRCQRWERKCADQAQQWPRDAQVQGAQQHRAAAAEGGDRALATGAQAMQAVVPRDDVFVDHAQRQRHHKAIIASTVAALSAIACKACQSQLSQVPLSGHIAVSTHSPATMVTSHTAIPAAAARSHHVGWRANTARPVSGHHGPSVMVARSSCVVRRVLGSYLLTINGLYSIASHAEFNSALQWRAMRGTNDVRECGGI